MPFNQPPFDQQLGEQFERASKRLTQILPKLLPIAAGVLVVLWLASGIYSVHPGHVGVVRTFGKETARTEPGLNYRFPWPFQQADVVSVEQIRRIEVGFRGAQRVQEEALMLTGDENIVEAQIVVQYRVADPSKFLFRLREPEVALGAATEVALRSTVGSMTIDQVMIEERAKVQDDARVFIQRLMDAYESGLVITEVKLQAADPLKFFKTVRDESGARARLDDLVFSELRGEVASHTFATVIGTKREAIMDNVAKSVRTKAGEFGIEVVDVRIKRADLPKEVQQSVFARMQAEREREAKRYRSEGEEEANKLRSQTDKERTIVLADAEQNAQKLRGEGDATATRIYADAPARRTETGVHVEPHQTLRRILVPVDFTPASVHSLRRAARLAERFGSTVLLLHVIETHPFAMNGPAEMLMKDDEEVTRDSTEQLSRLGREELGPHVSARPLVRRGKKAAREILHTAETLDCDLIIMAAHKRTALGRALFGSTADQVRHHAPCAVLVIPCTDQPQLEYTLWKDSEEPVALAVRDYVSTCLEPDEFSVGRPNYSYPVHSLYLDSDDLHLYQSTINSEKNRYKLRLRFYSDQPDTPVFFEIKRRVDNAILKQRGGVKRQAVDWLLAGHIPEPAHLTSNEPKHLFALQHFCELMKRLEAKPKVHVAYLREAWLPHDGNSVRVTMDRQVRDDPEPTARLSTQMKNPVLVFGDSVILEIKFTGRFPQWLTDMVRAFNLRPCSAAKYVDGIGRMSDVWGGGPSSEFVSKLLLAKATVQKATGERFAALRSLARPFESGSFARLQPVT